LKRSTERSTVFDVGERLDSLCDKIFVMIDGFELKQMNDVQFGLNLPFLSTESSLTRAALEDMEKTYEALWRDVMDVADMSFRDFENLFPRLNINFETYYSVAVSLLNMIYHMKLMKLYCYRLLGQC
jgi:hypothetical protein